VTGVTIPSDPGLAPWQTFPLAVAPGTDVQALSNRLRDEGLETRRYYWPPLHGYALFGHQPSLPVTEDISSRALCLPVYSDLRDDEQSEIVEIFTRVWSAQADRQGW
jgi:dTDP-4-amino-4,6-dideoxygalactose transaminase